MLRVKCGHCAKMLRFDETKIKAKSITLKCPSCDTQNKVTLPNTPQVKPTPKRNPVLRNSPDSTGIMEEKTQIDAEMGWLVVHTENMEAKTFPLKVGQNKIGRLTSSNVNDLGIRLEGDTYISRKHCIVEVVDNPFRTDYILYEFSEKPSLNGTWLNTLVIVENGIIDGSENNQIIEPILGYENKNPDDVFKKVVRKITQTDQLYLKDGETIQIGRTKVVLKTKKKVRNAAAAKQAVGKTAIAKTVIV
jgi:pSer/pThr/pTyr-binding forkhead associated (FHA) protein/phage FluMu protein Com